jgi:hypothetical protein
MKNKITTRDGKKIKQINFECQKSEIFDGQKSTR